MSDPTIAYAILGTIIAIILAAILYLQSKANQADEVDIDDGQQNVRARHGPQGGNRAAANRNARERLRATLAERRGEEFPAEEDEEEDNIVDEREDDEDQEEVALPKGKIGKKKAAKLEAKAEKRAQRLTDEREREEKKARDALKAEEQKTLKEYEAAEETKRAEEERKIQEEKESKEQEEYEKMKLMFSVEDSGYDKSIDEDSEKNLLRDFVEYIKKEKVVVLEELAARFRLKTQAAINRLTDLQANGTLTGVLDDRGKFIYISVKELEDIAKFIRQRGRITLSELAEASGTLISLTPDVPLVPVDAQA